MRRREFITLIGGATSWALAARAQQPVMPIVGLVSPRSPEDSARLGAAFRKALSETGYIDSDARLTLPHVGSSWRKRTMGGGRGTPVMTPS
jgi:hypothetical protein